ncbi:uncharacterized protein J4E79_000719 [Alternaria viburni]|uniref:uncharacterized protein n=1 Tax=Alternaria viburni TaxID=566460 RepID=UPI0020C51E4F|nr:uncharacterized protein J4E79_000719 [Alternaria viburni]KAI4670438.1 hypothetical protein J4E79_000719 [Alternaria viburni]
MQPDRLIHALTIIIQILISLVLFAIVLPFFILWRVPISLLYFTKNEKPQEKNADQERERLQGLPADEEEEEPKPPPPPDLHERALAPYTQQWTAFKSRPINQPLVAHWSRVACLSLLTIQTTLTLALLEKSLVYHIPCEDILFEQPGDTAGGYQDPVQQTPPVAVQPPAPAARFDKNPYTLAGIASIWTGQKEKMKGGYDGRDVRKQNFADDIEMADWVGRK